MITERAFKKLITFGEIAEQDVASILAAQMAEKRTERLEQEAHRPPFNPRRHYAYMLNGCARQLVYAHTNWEEKEPFTAGVVSRMKDGQQEEKQVIRKIIDDGFEVVEQQVQLDDDKYFITGRIDGKLKWQGHKVPFEVKRLNPFVFDKINAATDLKNDVFLMKYLRQLTLYLLLHSQASGLLILSNGLGDRKYIPVPLDYELGEAILRDLDTANAHMKAGTLPERIPYHSRTCGYCPFKRTCLPDMNFGEGAIMGDLELNAAVARFATLKPSNSEYEKLKKSIAASVKDKPLIVAGDYLITGEWKERNVKAQEARTDRFWAWEIESKAGSNGHAT